MKKNRVIGLGAMVAAVVLLGACSSGGDQDDSAAGDADGVAEQGVTPDPAGGSDDAQATGEQTGQNRAGSNLLQEQALIQTAQLTVEVEDVLAAVRDAERMATGSGGRIENEQVSRHDGASANVRTAHVTLRVPGDAYESTLTGLAELGTLVDQVREAKDVTREVVDLESRIASQRESIGRVRAILADANRLADVVTIEGELTRRQADLESLLAQRKALADQTDLTTIQVTFVPPGEEAAEDEDDPELGFLSGLRNGWEALAAVVVLALTVLGALLPFAIIGLPVVWLALRATRSAASRSARRAAPAPATADGGPKPE